MGFNWWTFILIVIGAPLMLYASAVSLAAGVYSARYAFLKRLTEDFDVADDADDNPDND